MEKVQLCYDKYRNEDQYYLRLYSDPVGIHQIIKLSRIDEDSLRPILAIAEKLFFDHHQPAGTFFLSEYLFQQNGMDISCLIDRLLVRRICPKGQKCDSFNTSGKCEEALITYTYLLPEQKPKPKVSVKTANQCPYCKSVNTEIINQRQLRPWSVVMKMRCNDCQVHFSD